MAFMCARVVLSVTVCGLGGAVVYVVGCMAVDRVWNFVYGELLQYLPEDGFTPKLLVN
jgi:hypothetical protein